ncbi:MAG: AAA family ATPase [Dysgonamonadaceae bacterium]|jgi:predicted cytidylate kinase|nr:AAA family ATPase [Dysgonamonadaceae bacterium]
MHISITGDLGSGKSTVAKSLSEILHFPYLSMGLIQRQLGQERGMNTLEFNKFAQEHREIDEYIDQKLRDINDLQTESFILDSRLAWHFVKQSFKVDLMAAGEVAALRVFKDEQRIAEPSAKNLLDKMNDQKERLRIERARFEKHYGVKPSLFRDFDAIVDTSSASVPEVTTLILTLYRHFERQEPFNKWWLSPHRIFPTKNVPPEPVPAGKNTVISPDNNGLTGQTPIHCVLYNKEFFVVKGHQRLSDCLTQHIPFVPVVLLAKNNEPIAAAPVAADFRMDSFDTQWIDRWEKRHGFRFFHYPPATL